MKITELSVNDRRWMFCRLKRTAWIAALLLTLNIAAKIGYETNNVSAGLKSNSVTDENVKSIAPNGWRRTNRGWEHVSSWDSSRTSINTLMETQAEREPELARGLLAKVSKLSPLTFAICQLGAIVAIALATQSVSRSPEKEGSAVRLGSAADAIDGSASLPLERLPEQQPREAT